MKQEQFISNNTLSFDIEELLHGIKNIQEDKESFKEEEGTDLDFDPEFAADFIKAQFVEYIYMALEKQNLSKSSFANKLNKSRQYVGRVLNETANFTIESMAEISCSLKLNLTIEMSEPQKISSPQNIYKFNVPSINHLLDNTYEADNSIPSKEKLQHEEYETGYFAAS